jgi:hypothetical protein
MQDVSTAGVRHLWPDETLRLTRKLSQIAPQGIFSTGIENSDPWVLEERRDQLREAFDFRENFASRLQNIKALGISWVRFGEGYSFVHPQREIFDFRLTDQVVAQCRELGLTLIADLLHFGLPAWLHAETPATPFFQNALFPQEFARYAAAFTRRYPSVRYFSLVNEPYFTARASAKDGLYNERILAEGMDDRAYVRAVANIAQAAILAREAIERTWQEDGREDEPLFFQNDSFQKAYAGIGSGRQAEARRFNLRRYAPSDLTFGHHDEEMRNYLIAQSLGPDEYDWFMTHGSKSRMILGVDYYPGNVRLLQKDGIVHRSADMPYLLYRLTAEYWRRYRMPLLHMEINAPPEHAVTVCRKTHQAIARLRRDGYPMLGMAWFGDDHQVGWQGDLLGPNSHTDYRVGLFYKGKLEPVGRLFSRYAQRGFPALPV